MNPYGTHQPVLRALAPIGKRVLELGGGIYSTRLFLTYPHLTSLVTVEDDPGWARNVTSQVEAHTVVEQSGMDYAANGDLDFDLIFVDNAVDPNDRRLTIKTLAVRRPRAVVVIHDFEQEQYRDAAALFVNQWIYKTETPWTGVVWNEGCRHGSKRIRRLLPDD